MNRQENICLIEVPFTIFLASEVLIDKYGSGIERIERLRKAGYNPDTVQKCVNDLLNLFEKWGD